MDDVDPNSAWYGKNIRDVHKYSLVVQRLGYLVVAQETGVRFPSGLL